MDALSLYKYRNKTVVVYFLTLDLIGLAWL